MHHLSRLNYHANQTPPHTRHEHCELQLTHQTRQTTSANRPAQPQQVGHKKDVIEVDQVQEYVCASACKHGCCMSPVISSFLRDAVDTLFLFLSDSCATTLCFRSGVVFHEMRLRFSLPRHGMSTSGLPLIRTVCRHVDVHAHRPTFDAAL